MIKRVIDVKAKVFSMFFRVHYMD